MIHGTRTRRVRRVVLLATSMALVTTASSAIAQTRTCNISGSLAVTPQGVDAGGGTPTNVTATYTESGAFLTGIVAPDTTAMTLSLLPAVQTNPTWLLAPFFQTMGVNEGPNTCGQTGDNGTITYVSGPCGQIVDKFSVTSTNPYTLSHVLSGALNLGGVPNVAVGPITRNVTTSFTANGASGSVFFNDSTGMPFCNWTYSAVYNPCHPTVSLPVTYQAVAKWSSGDGSAANAFAGTIVRTQSNAAPAVPPVGLAGLVAALVAAGAALARRARA